MNKIPLILLAATTLALQACAYDQPIYSNAPASYGYTSMSVDVGHCSPRPMHHHQQSYQTYTVGPQYYRSKVPYYGQNVVNQTDAPIVMPIHSRGGQSSSVIIPQSW